MSPRRGGGSTPQKRNEDRRKGKGRRFCCIQFFAGKHQKSGVDEQINACPNTLRQHYNNIYILYRYRFICFKINSFKVKICCFAGEMWMPSYTITPVDLQISHSWAPVYVVILACNDFLSINISKQFIFLSDFCREPASPFGI